MQTFLAKGYGLNKGGKVGLCEAGLEKSEWTMLTAAEYEYYRRILSYKIGKIVLNQIMKGLPAMKFVP